MDGEPLALDAVDELQARFLDCLRAAEGRPLSFEQLRALGFENPATLCYELESAGVPLWRVERRAGPGCAVAMGVRVAPERASSPDASSAKHLSAAALAAHAREWGARARELAALTAQRTRESIAERRGSPRLGAAREHARQSAHVDGEQLRTRLRSWHPHSRHLRSASAGLAHPSKRTAVAAIALLAALAVVGWTLALTEQTSNTRARASLARAGAPATVRSSHRRGHTRRVRPASTHLSPRTVALQRTNVSSSTPPASGDAQPAAPASSAPAASAPASPTGGVEAPAAGSSTHATAIIPSRKAAPGPTAPRASAEELETQGHQLLAQGRYPEALSYLRAALAASGGSIGACATPSTQGCLIYAYALFDIGRALWLSGERGAAIGELEMRLQIDNQRQVVREEIARVRSSKA